MTRLPKPTSAAEAPSVEAVERLVAQREDELAIIEGDIASAEARRREILVGDDDDASFESAELAIDRLERKRLRAFVRLEQARAELAEAEAGEKEQRRKTRYEAGLAAEKEFERLTEEYAERAAALIETLRKIGQHADAIRVANDNHEHYAQRIDVPGLRISDVVVLPSATGEHHYVWCKGESAPQPQKHPGWVTFEGVLTPFDETILPAYAARAAEKSKPAIMPVAQRTAPQPKYGERELPDGIRVCRAAR